MERTMYSGALILTERSSASFRQRLAREIDPEDLEFDFVNGPKPSSAAAGIDLFYPGPYYCYWPANYTLDDLANARAWLKDYVARYGPYDGVMTFSQGCLLVSSLLLHHEKECASATDQYSSPPPPFKFAIFICGGVSLLELENNLDFTVAPELWELDKASRSALQARAASSAILAEGSNRWRDDVLGMTNRSTDELAQMLKGPYRIRIPTAHVVGSKDPRYFSGMLLANLCHAKVRKVFDHGGGHEIPRTEYTSSTIAQLIQWVSSPAVLMEADVVLDI